MLTRKTAREETCYICGAPVERERRLLDAASAARLCRVSRPTVYRWMRENAVDWVRLPLGRRRIYLDSLFEDPAHPVDFSR